MGIFCCGYCCAKGAGADNEKDKEANLSRVPEQMAVKKKTKDQTALPQDLSLQENQEEEEDGDEDEYYDEEEEEE